MWTSPELLAALTSLINNAGTNPAFTVRLSAEQDHAPARQDLRRQPRGIADVDLARRDGVDGRARRRGINTASIGGCNQSPAMGMRQRDQPR